MDSKKLNMALFGLKIGLIVIGAIICVMIMMGGGTDEMTGDTIANEGAINAGILFSMWIAIIAGAVAVGFGIAKVVLGGKKSIPTLIGIGVFAIIILIAYTMASSDVPSSWIKEDMTVDQIPTPGISKFAGTNIWSFYLLMLVGIGSIVIGEIVRIFK